MLQALADGETNPAGSLCSTGITRLHSYCGLIRHPLAFSPLPGFAGYRTYLPPAISHGPVNGDGEHTCRGVILLARIR
jgi:hypothetical protein